MRSYRVVLGPSPAGVVRGLHPELRRSIRNALRALADDPSRGEPLRGELEGLWRYRVRRFRIVYDVDRSRRTLRVVALGHQEGIYEAVAEARRRRSTRT
jgi:mRNA interferase RelE/StbE